MDHMNAAPGKWLVAIHIGLGVKRVPLLESLNM